jgi:hypothetical protein
MLTRGSLLLLVLSLARASSEPNRPDAAATVRGYFDALSHNDFQRALSLTAGPALERTQKMVGTLRQQAAAAHARVELNVKRVEVSPPQAVRTPPIPVEVSFDIDVVGKKWWFKKVARTLAGRAQFYVDGVAPRIVAIEGRLY